MQDDQYRPRDVEHYPLHMIVSILSPSAVDEALAALAAANVPKENIDVAQGDADAQRIVDGTEGGPLSRIGKFFAEETSQRDDYVQALRDGEAVIRVLLQDEAQKTSIAQLLSEHGGHFINYYGRWTVETLAN